METNVTIIKCKRCGHEWFPRKKDVRICPKCKSARFDQEKTANAGKSKGTV
jgi:uncharacterized OB-fold protein